MLSVAALGDWPQWRGPLRNGVLPDSPKLLDAIPAGGLKELWESEPIPSEDDGGLSSPVTADGRVFIGLVWHRNIPSETRRIDELVLRQLGFEGMAGLSEELITEMEMTRESIPPTLRGKKLDEFIAQWIDEHFNTKLKLVYGGFISERFKKGRLAIPLAIFAVLEEHKGHLFANEAEMQQWLEAQGWPVDIRNQIIAAVPPTIRVAEDALVCLAFETGKTLWRATAPGAPLGRSASATPCVVEGKVFAVGSSRLWCVDAQTGKTIWETPLEPKRGIGSSPLVTDGAVIVNADGLIAFETATGKVRWRQEKAGGGNSSPVAWRAGDKVLVIVNGRNELQAVDSQSGTILWTAPGGGVSTPAIVGNTLAMQTRQSSIGVIAYELTSSAAKKLWNRPMEAMHTQSSAIIDENAVYLMDDNVHFCLDLATGDERWRKAVPSEIASPVLADGKLFVVTNNGNTLLILKATPTKRAQVGKATVRAQWVPSPCISDGRLILRMKDKLKCWSLLR